MKSLLVAIVTYLQITTAGICAEVASMVHDGKGLLMLFGEITEGDADRVERQIKEFHGKGIVIHRMFLASSGGLVSEALRIGRIVRKNSIFTVAPHTVLQIASPPVKYRRCTGKPLGRPFLISDPAGLPFEKDAEVEPQCICASACSLIWFGGLRRSGQVGVHRSYFTGISPDTSFEDFSQALSDTNTEILEYMKEMRVPLEVSEEMQATASSDLSFFDASDLGIGIQLSSDGLFDEFMRAQSANQCPAGLSDEESRVMTDLMMVAELGYYFNEELKPVDAKLSQRQREILDVLKERAAIHSNCMNRIISDVQAKSQGMR